MLAIPGTGDARITWTENVAAAAIRLTEAERARLESVAAVHARPADAVPAW